MLLLFCFKLMGHFHLYFIIKLDKIKKQLGKLNLNQNFLFNGFTTEV